MRERKGKMMASIFFAGTTEKMESASIKWRQLWVEQIWGRISRVQFRACSV